MLQILHTDQMNNKKSIVPRDFDFSMVADAGENLIHTMAWNGLVDDFKLFMQ